MASQKHSIPDEHHVKRTGDWLSPDSRHQKDWLKRTINHVDSNPKDLHPVLLEFKETVENDSRLYMLFHEMFQQIPKNKAHLSDPSGDMHNVRDFNHVLKLLNHIISTAPSWTDSGHSVGVVGVPINALLDWSMATPAGFTAFQDPKVNAMLKKILDTWGEFLRSPKSAKVLDDSKEGWFGPTGKQSLATVANVGKTELSFEELFECDPSKPHHGFTSWDNWFTRVFREGRRPVASPDDDNIIANACESKTYKVSTDVKMRDRFWVKGQPYSVRDMLANDPLSNMFVGGTVYQAFLSALSYHRWHSPISGTIKKAYVVQGTYFSEPLYEDFFNNDNNNNGNTVVEENKDEKTGKELAKEGENVSQEYLSVMATRAILFIEADNKEIGTMAFMGVGMVEVSTCDITVKEGQHVKKGDQIGSFHFGGSTWVALFRKGLKLEGFPQPGGEHNVPVRSELCRVVS